MIKEVAFLRFDFEIVIDFNIVFVFLIINT
jgi:hypothetical protein